MRMLILICFTTSCLLTSFNAYAKIKSLASSWSKPFMTAFTGMVTGEVKKDTKSKQAKKKSGLWFNIMNGLGYIVLDGSAAPELKVPTVQDMIKAGLTKSDIYIVEDNFEEYALTVNELAYNIREIEMSRMNGDMKHNAIKHAVSYYRDFFDQEVHRAIKKYYTGSIGNSFPVLKGAHPPTHDLKNPLKDLIPPTHDINPSTNGAAPATDDFSNSELN